MKHKPSTQKAVSQPLDTSIRMFAQLNVHDPLHFNLFWFTEHIVTLDCDEQWSFTFDRFNIWQSVKKMVSQSI